MKPLQRKFNQNCIDAVLRARGIHSTPEERQEKREAAWVEENLAIAMTAFEEEGEASLYQLFRSSTIEVGYTAAELMEEYYEFELDQTVNIAIFGANNLKDLLEKSVRSCLTAAAPHELLKYDMEY